MFQHDKRTEGWLDSLGVQYEYKESIGIDELAPGWDVINAGRPDAEPKIQDAIATYAELMESGSAAPATIVWHGRDGYDVLDGVQRTHAAILADFHNFAAFVVKCSDSTRQKIRIAANIATTTAAPVDPEWCIAKLVEEWMINGSDSAKDIAGLCRRSVAEVESVYRRLTTRAHIASVCGGKDKVSLKAGVIDAIAEATTPADFDDAPKAISSFVRILDKCNFRNGEAVRFVREFFGVKRGGNASLETRLRSKIREIERDPFVARRLSGQRKLTDAEKIHDGFKSLHTRVKAHKASKAEPFDDRDLIKDWHNTYFEIGRLLREQCSTEIRRGLEPFETTTRPIK